MPDDRAARLLVIKLGAFGDMVVAMAAVQAIRRGHPQAHITLLTTPPYRSLVEGSGCFDEVWATPRPSRVRFWQERGLARAIGRRGFDRIYDLQWSGLTNRLFKALGSPKPAWVGVAPGCSHFYADRKAAKPIAERHAEMLRLVGIEASAQPDFGYLRAPLPSDLPSAYALVVPGGAPRRVGKRWPPAHYLELCRRLAADGLVPLLVGGPAEAAIVRSLREGCPEARHYTTDWALIAELARGARVAVGNDTGPSHLIAASNCPTVVLFGPETDPTRVGLRGRRVQVLRSSALADLSVDDVHRAAKDLMGARHPGR